MNRKAGSTELIEMDSIAYVKNITVDGIRNEPKSILINKPETVSFYKIELNFISTKYFIIF